MVWIVVYVIDDVVVVEGSVVVLVYAKYKNE